MKFNLLKPKRIFWVSVFSSVIFLFPLSGLAVTVQEVPNPRKEYGGWVTDMAGILSDDTETQINQMISELEAKKGTEMAVVTVSETSSAASPKKFATQLFNYWGIGKKGQDNGVLFLISVGDRRVEIETGYGVEAILPDARVGNIIDTQIIPQFKKGDFAGGTLAGTRALIAVFKSAQPSSGSQVIPPDTQTTPNNTGGGILWGVLAAGGILTLAAGSAVYLNRRPRKIFIAPEGRTHKSEGNYTFLCADCQKSMEQVDDLTVQSYLNKAETTAQKLGNIKFLGWKCPSCIYKTTSNGFHIVAQQSPSSRFCQCPQCHELTLTRDEKTVQVPTQVKTGKRLITDKCHYCSYHHQKEKIIPRLPPLSPPPRNSWGSSGGSYNGGDSGGGFGGGGFGGGDSGGGGGGGSW
ncbi:TPM domain-containing protein [Nostocaceae cyanobacterium CENA357]|uniref:TPM domain-containing protein n=1 Tax=Atlanticothrix silvestris CENA357 TaxID=1725252 RepID=A0A8J7L5Q7_9CYAN|nr:TPM domain-containing protein [Atlanticothrix silvestris CENA357]